MPCIEKNTSRAIRLLQFFFEFLENVRIPFVFTPILDLVSIERVLLRDKHGLIKALQCFEMDMGRGPWEPGR